MLKNSAARYGSVTKALHWFSAVLVFCLLAIGLTMGDAPLADRIRLYNLHKSLGILVLALSLSRVVWHIFSKKPALVASLKPYEKKAAHVAHVLLYAALLGMPMSGWLMSSAHGRSVSFFGLFQLPDFVTQNPALAERLETVHETMAYALMAMIALHVVAAIKHHVIDKDNTLRRMLPFGGAKEEA
ncbi:MAG: cytochrome b [Alphaproteobacteria bacterium]|nr:cytochrome b [Alphaproteobacteria bacterium]